MPLTDQVLKSLGEGECYWCGTDIEAGQCADCGRDYSALVS